MTWLRWFWFVCHPIMYKGRSGIPCWPWEVCAPSLALAHKRVWFALSSCVRRVGKGCTYLETGRTLKDVDILLSLDEYVYSPIGRMTFHFGVKTHHLEDNPNRILEIEFRIAHHLIIAIGEEGFQSLHETIHLALLHIFHEISYERRCLGRPDGGEIGAEEIELSALDEFVKQCRLVRIEIVIGADGFEVLYADRIFMLNNFPPLLEGEGGVFIFLSNTGIA